MQNNHTKGKAIFTVWDNEILGKHVELSIPTAQLKIAEIPYLDTPAIENAERMVKCWNEHDELIDALTQIQKKIESCINGTGSGVIRNILCDANLIALSKIQKP